MIEKIKNFKKREPVPDAWRDMEIKKGRRKGAVLVEFIIALPIFVLLLWGIVNMVVYLIAAANLNEAAYEASRALAKEMRGQEGAIIETKHTDDIPTQVELVTKQNGFVKFGKPGTDTQYVYEGVVVPRGGTATECEALKEDRSNKNYLCAYVSEYVSSSGRIVEQVVVEMRSEFDIIGEMIPGISDYVRLSAKAAAQKELPGRYDYVD